MGPFPSSIGGARREANDGGWSMTGKSLWMMLLVMTLTAARAWAAPVADWKNVSASNTGGFVDDKGSIASYQSVEGQTKEEKALALELRQNPGGFCGVWHDTAVDLSKATYLRFMAKADPPCTLQFTLTDANKAQFVASVAIPSADWIEVKLPLTSFELNKYYQAEGVDTNKSMDPALLLGMGWSLSASGASKVVLGPIQASLPETKAQAAVSKKAPKTGGKPVTLVMQEFDSTDEGLGGVWKDEKGTTLELSYKAAPKKDKADDRTCNLAFNLVAGGWCGMWYRAGSNWDGVDFTGAKSLVVKAFTAKPLEFGISLEDVNKVKYDAVTPVATTGGRWENVVIPLDNAPAELALVKTFNLYMKTAGENLMSIDTITVVK
jgi:hypothetical protein